MSFSKGCLRNITSIAAAAAWLVHAPVVQALEVEAGDYEVYPVGVNIGLLYYQHAETGNLYANGTKVASDFKVTQDVGLLRYIRPMQAWSPAVTFEPQVILPFGQVKGSDNASVLGSASGAGDLIVGMPFKFLLDASSRDAFSIGPFLYIPTGNYDKTKPLNLGTNTWQGLLQFAYVTHFNPTWALDLVADVAVHGDNNKYGSTDATMKEAANYEAQAHLRYYVTPATFVAADYGYKFGGNESVNGVSSDDKIKTQYARLTTTSFLTPTWQLSGQVGADLKAENGPKEKARFNLRLAKIF
jgi:hypothetical protein